MINKKKLSKQSIIRDEMSIGSIMDEFRILTNQNFTFNEITSEKIQKDLGSLEELDPKLLFYLKNYTPKKSIYFLGETILTYDAILQTMKKDWPIKRIAKYQFIPISKGNNYTYQAVDAKTGKTYMIASSIYIGDNVIEAFDWKESKPITKENVIEAAKADYDYDDNIFETFITYIIDLESEN